jgi:hypothetical protein
MTKCRPHALFAEFVKLSPQSISDEIRGERRRQVLGE